MTAHLPQFRIENNLLYVFRKPKTCGVGKDEESKREPNSKN